MLLDELVLGCLLKQRVDHTEVDLKQLASHAEKQQKWKNQKKSSERQLQLFLNHAGKDSS